MCRTLSDWIVTCLILLALSPGLGMAANRTLCFGGFRFDDDRVDGSTASEVGARRGVKSGNNYMIGAWFDIYDYDSDGSDDYIGRFQVRFSGLQCYTFPWEGEPYQGGETHPDLFVKFINVVQSTTGGNTVQAVDEDWNVFGNTSWRNVTRYDNCAGTCTNLDDHIVSSDSTSYSGARMAALDSVQHTLEVYEQVMSEDILMSMVPCEHPCANDGQALDRGRVVVSQPHGRKAMTAPHEIGHCLQMQLFDRDGLMINCEKSGSGHSPLSDEWESCATAEGWADYVAAVSWWDPDNSGSTPDYDANSLETAAPSQAVCSDNSSRQLQVSRAFWDLDDANNEGGESPANTNHDDIYNSSSQFIANGWQEFATGNQNRQDFEGYPFDDEDAVNIWDYYYNNEGRFADSNALVETLVWHNCLQNQTTN